MNLIFLDKSKLEKYLTWISVLAVVLLVCTLIPMIIIGFYTHPLGDDYYYGRPAIYAIQNGEGFFGAISAAFRGTINQYNIWQGTYSAMFLMHLPPQLWGNFCYKLYPAFIILFLTSGLFYFFGALIVKEDAIDKKIWLAISATVAALHVGFVPLCGETYYWYNGSMYYTGYYALSLFFFGGIVKYIRKPGPVRLVCLSIAALFIAGGNYVSLLPSAIILFFLVVFSFAERKTKPFGGLLTTFLFLMAGFAVSILAPGNALRQATIHGSTPLKAILNALKQCSGFLLYWSNIYFFVALLLLTPAIVYLAKKSKHEFKFPILSCVVFFGIFASSECPTFYAQSNSGPARVFDVSFYIMLLCIGFIYYYLVGGVTKIIERKGGADHPVAISACAGSVIIVLLCVLAFMRPVESTFSTNNAIKATVSLINGEAAYYDNQFKERQRIIQNGKGTDVVVKAYDVPENLIYFLWLGDMSTESEANGYYAEYFSLKSIRIE